MNQDSWSTILHDHPIFSVSSSNAVPQASSAVVSSQLVSTSASADHAPSPNNCRRQTMVLKDADLIVAAGTELRITSLSDKKMDKSTGKSYKVLRTPNIQFNVRQLAVNASGKLLAVAGEYELAVVVLPRAGYPSHSQPSIDCKSIQVGQLYHQTNSAPITKVEWHPWGEAGSTLMVLTLDGKLREYDISLDPDEPQQTLSFAPQKKSRSYMAEDPVEREAISFTLGRGKADWGPLTVYTVMRSGDVYAICPYLPRNAYVPSSYIHALNCFITAKQEFLHQEPSISSGLTSMYDYQRKYVSALVKQIPSDVAYPSTAQSISLRPPAIIKSKPMRQGPFLLQPSPKNLDGSEGFDATDIAYLAVNNEDDDNTDGQAERLGVVVIGHQDGRVDVCLDVEKVEAKWESKQDSGSELPMFAVYETIDLGLVLLSKQITGDRLDTTALSNNHLNLSLDPIHDDTVYAYHSFGIHSLQFEDLLRSLNDALRQEGDGPEADSAMKKAVQNFKPTRVSQIQTTGSLSRRQVDPVIALCIPNDVYLSYSMVTLTSSMKVANLPLSLRTGVSQADSPDVVAPPQTPKALIEAPAQADKENKEPPAYISLLREPFTPPEVLSDPSSLAERRQAAITSLRTTGEFMLTPDSLRALGTTVEILTGQIYEIILAYKVVNSRAIVLRAEADRQQEKAREMLSLLYKMKGPDCLALQSRMSKVQENHKTISAKLERTLNAMIAKAAPGLSEYETRWFEELKRMKVEVAGRTRYDDESLASRAAALKREYDRILPGLKSLTDRMNERKPYLSQNNHELGVSQAFAFGEQSNSERVRIADLEQQILRMGSKLGISVSKPPSSRRNEATVNRDEYENSFSL
ncbi:hypothetical protein CONPUDRAFT_123331 [Coniophora puteana RWD-64-598 SS2]|uniref:Uncharacterized protein n=1 Tax=Coniophora puteana (strain RWD-64-598) TaxID=741705 RepID=A0A5M3MTD5_CONPW|nr:uncharacterized protein CONPUDRAFT_123331 [Coniophora puteana RWD-64-598 SS2]EIW82422.1 hypothetical protein CONPUDRAFT_123331 [Coniophora puteana RWD-64-598 SS2]